MIIILTNNELEDKKIRDCYHLADVVLIQDEASSAWVYKSRMDLRHHNKVTKFFGILKEIAKIHFSWRGNDKTNTSTS